MEKLFTEKQAKKFLRENNIKDGKTLENAFIDQVRELIQIALEEERTAELGYEKYDHKNKDVDNSRNGSTEKTIRSQFGEMKLRIPRDQKGEFEPVIVKKHETKISETLDDLVTSLYAKGVGTRDITSHMEKIYGISYSAEQISRITDKILPVAKEWQTRPLDPMYPILFLDGVVFNVQQDGQVTKKTACLVYGITVEGKKDVLGIWIGEAESSKFWMKVLVDMKNRGVKDVLISCVDGLKGFKEAIESAFPKTEIQKCIVHQIRTSTRFVSYRDRKPFCADMKEIYTVPNEEAGTAALDRFGDKWDKKYSYAIKSWRDNWPELSTFYKYPEEIRRLIYTTNPMESFNRKVRKFTKAKGSFPTDDSLFKLLYLIVIDSSKKWTAPVHNWGIIVNQLRIYFGDRMDEHL